MLTSEVLSNDDELRGVDHKVVDRGKVGGDVVQVNEVRRRHVRGVVVPTFNAPSRNDCLGKGYPLLENDQHFPLARIVMVIS